MNLLNKIKNCKTVPELNELRLEIVIEGKSDIGIFKQLQKEFVKKKNKLERIPSFNRTW